MHGWRVEATVEQGDANANRGVEFQAQLTVVTVTNEPEEAHLAALRHLMADGRLELQDEVRARIDNCESLLGTVVVSDAVRGRTL